MDIENKDNDITKENKKCTIFMESLDIDNDGKIDKYTYSMRRVCAFILYVLSVILGLISLISPVIIAFINKTNIEFNPLAILASIGVPAGLATLVLFFTTWNDISELAKNIKK